MLTDFVDDDLLSEPSPLHSPAKTMLTMTHSSKFRPSYSVRWTHGISDDNYTSNLTHVRCARARSRTPPCLCEKQQHSHSHCKITIIWMEAHSLSIDVCLLNTLTPGLSSSLEQSSSSLLSRIFIDGAAGILSSLSVIYPTWWVWI